MGTYEGMYIINPTLNEEGVKNIISQINNIFSKRNCSVLEVLYLGVKQLAYEINGLTMGRYMKITVNGDSESIAEFDFYCIKNEYILRHVLMRKN